MVNRLIALALIGSVLWSGCAQYKRPPMMIKVPSYYDNRVTLQGLTIVADPYVERGKIEHLFNTNLLDKGFLATQLIVFNDSDHVYDFANVKITLLRDDGIVLTPVSPEKVSKKVLRSTSLRMIGWGFAGLIILSIPLSLAAGVDSRRANKDIKRTLKENVFKSSKIDPNEVVSGFYFFKIGKSASGSLPCQYRFRIERLLEVDSEREYEFNIGIG